MSDKEQQHDEQKAAVAVSAEQVSAKTQDKPEPKQPTRKPRQAHPHRSHAGLWSLLVTIALLGGAGWYGYQWFLQSQQQIASLQQNQANLLAQNQQFAEQFNRRLAAMNEGQKALTKYVEVIREKDQHLRKDWLVMEAEYLIQLANYRLLFERDINTAIVALHSADQRLKDAADPALLNTRKVLADSIQSLKQVEQADLAGLSLTLSAVNKELEKLPLNTPDPIAKAHAADTDLAETNKVSSWKDLPAAIWRDLKTLIVIRDHDQPIGPLLSPQQRFFLVENLRLQLEQARLAMLTGQVDVFQERIQTAIQWIETHFDKEAALTKSTLDTLQQLSQAAIAPELPDISAAYQALQKYQANADQGSNTTAPAPPAAAANGTN